MDKGHSLKRSLTASSSEASVGTEQKRYTLTNYDILTVFQAAPLAYRDLNGGIHPIGMLDFDTERELLSCALKEAQTVDAKIDIAFETATTDRLGAFLAKSDSQVLHFSCHGHPEYLFVEDGWGAGQVLFVNDLKEWIKEGGSKLRFVFVSACHSRSAGEAFLAAGVPHVVCCQRDSQQFRNSAAVEFARAFYRALACCRTLKEAFELGKKGVQLSPTVEDACNEMKNFALLPEDGNHDVPIFFTKPLPKTFAPKTWNPSRSRMFPVPPQPFVGRSLDMFRIMDALRTSRIVRVSGAPGTGKCCLVKAVCQYVFKRNLMDDMFWLPTDDHKQNGENIVGWLSQLFEEFQSNSRASTFRCNTTYKTCRGEILDELHDKKALIIVDARKIQLHDGIKKLTTFLEDLFDGTRHTKVIVVHRLGDDIHSKQFSFVEADVELSPLDYKSAVTLFSSLCRHASDSDELRKLLIAQHKSDSDAMTHRAVEIFKMIGDGIPARINNRAKSLTSSDYDRMVSIAKRPAPTTFRTRAALEQCLTQLQKEIEVAINANDFRRAKEIQETLDEMEVQLEGLQDLATLRMMADGVRLDKEQAVYMKDFGEAETLQKELDFLNAQITLEEDDTPDEDLLVIDTRQNNIEPSSMLFRRTRACLAAEARKLERTLEEACDNNDFRQTRIIDGKLRHLKLRLDKLPSADQLSMQLRQLKAEVKEAKNDRNWERAETLHHKAIDVEKKLQLERDAEKEMGESVPKEDHDANDETKIAAVSQSVETAQRGLDPPGVYVGVVDEVVQELGMHAGVDEELRKQIIRPREENPVRPGAFAVGGPTGRSDESEEIETTGNNSDVPTEEASFTVPEHEYETQAFLTEGQSDDAKISEGSETEQEGHANDESSVVKHSLLPQAAMSSPTPAIHPERPAIIVNDRILTAKEADKYCKRKGLCRLCGQVQTHRRKLFGFSLKTVPLTTTDANGNYTVYKGYCLGRRCYTLEQAKLELGEDQRPAGHKKMPQRRQHATSMSTTSNERKDDDSRPQEHNIAPSKSKPVRVPTFPRADLQSSLPRQQQEENFFFPPSVGAAVQHRVKKKKKKRDRVQAQSAAADADKLKEEEDLPVATVVAVDGDQAKERYNVEKENLEELIRKTISGMTVAATKVEVEESSGKQDSDESREKKGPGKRDGDESDKKDGQA